MRNGDTGYGDTSSLPTCAPPAFLPRVIKRTGTKRLLSMQEERVKGRHDVSFVF